MNRGRQRTGQNDHADLESFGPALRRYFRRHVDPVDADDLLQEVFVGMQARRSDAPIENVQGYIFSVAANVLRRHQRGGAVARRTFPDSTQAPESPSESPSAERLLIGRDNLRRALSIIEQLPPRTREVFILHRFEEISYSAIAARLGVSVSAIEKHIMLALRALLELRNEDR
jgi:RNA polymerase sigma factor (sigma-70 family)